MSAKPNTNVKRTAATCANCFFCFPVLLYRFGGIPLYKFWNGVGFLACGINPPTTPNAYPETVENACCAYWTDKDTHAQPYRHLAPESLRLSTRTGGK